MMQLAENENVIELLKKWMFKGFDREDDLQDEEVRMTGALCIGNIARSDKTCSTLMKIHRVGPFLLALLEKETAIIIAGRNEQTKHSIKVIHAVVGALKNISLGASNRKDLGEIGTLAKVTFLFRFSHLTPIHHSCLSILRNLCGGDNEGNVYRLLTGLEPSAPLVSSLQSSNSSTPLSEIVNLVAKSSEERESGIRNEAGRVIVNIIRAIQRTNGLHELNLAVQFLPIITSLNCVALIVQIITGAQLLALSNDSDQIDEDRLDLDSFATLSKVFPSVQNEGILALALLLSSNITKANNSGKQYG